MPPASLALSGDARADELLAADPLALLIGMVLDQQVPLERAFRSPYDLRERLGVELDAGAIAAMEPEALAATFAKPPALHRFPASMAGRVQAMCSTLVSDYAGQAVGVWEGVTSGDELLRRARALPGFGDMKARIFVALLGKQLGVTPPGWVAASEPFGAPGTYMSVADIVDADSLARVRQHKAAVKAAWKAARIVDGARTGGRGGSERTGPVAGSGEVQEVGEHLEALTAYAPLGATLEDDVGPEDTDADDGPDLSGVARAWKPAPKIRGGTGVGRRR